MRCWRCSEDLRLLCMFLLLRGKNGVISRSAAGRAWSFVYALTNNDWVDYSARGLTGVEGCVRWGWVPRVCRLLILLISVW